MKLFLLALFVSVATTSPIPDDSGPVDVIVNGVPEGQALDLGHIVDVKLQEHANGEVVVASDLLHPFTAVGIAEAAAAAEVSQPEIDAPETVVLPLPLPEAVVLPTPVAPEVVPEAIILPVPAAPEVVPEPVILPAPAAPQVIPEPVVLPAPSAPEVILQPVVLPTPAKPEVVPESVAPVPIPEVTEELLPVPAAQIEGGEIFNDGNVQVSVNLPEEPGILSTLQSWFNMAVNYINSSGVQTTQQIV